MKQIQGLYSKALFKWLWLAEKPVVRHSLVTVLRVRVVVQLGSFELLHKLKGNGLFSVQKYTLIVIAINDHFMSYQFICHLISYLIY